MKSNISLSDMLFENCPCRSCLSNPFHCNTEYCFRMINWNMLVSHIEDLTTQLEECEDIINIYKSIKEEEIEDMLMKGNM